MTTWQCIHGGTHGHTFGCDASGSGTYAQVVREANKHQRDTLHGVSIADRARRDRGGGDWRRRGRGWAGL